MKKQKPSKDPRFFYALSFFSGVAITTIFYWFMFKDPKRITIAGVTTMVGILLSISTFLLALWSALKVNKWLNNKIQDKGFKQAEKILELIENVTVHVEPLRKQLDNVRSLVESFGPIIFNKEDKVELEANCARVHAYCEQIYMSERMLKYWDTKVSVKGMESLKQFTDSLFKMGTDSKRLPFIVNSQVYDDTLADLRSEYFTSMDAMRKLLDFSYTELFAHNSNNR